MKKIAEIAFLPFLCMIVIWMAHFNSHSHTMLNQWSYENSLNRNKIDQQGISEAVEYHKQEPAFARRPVTTWMIEHLSNRCKIPIGTSFIIINFFLLFLIGILLFLYATELGFDRKVARSTQVFFYSGFSILFAFYQTNYTYDEPITYLSFIAAMIFFLRNKTILFACFFFMACLSRESIYLFVPGYLYLSYMKTNRISTLIQTGFVFACVLVLHFIAIKFFYPSFFTNQSNEEMQSRLSLIHFNFQNLDFARESIVSIFLIMLLPIYLIQKNWNMIKANTLEQRMMIIFLVVFILNTLIIFFSAFARESRLFALPLLPILPYLGNYFLIELLSFKHFKHIKIGVSNVIFILINLFVVVVAYHFLFHIYNTTIQLRIENLNAEYLFVTICLIVIFNINSLIKNQNPISVDQDIYT